MFLYEDKKFMGKKIKQFRRSAKLSQAELSEKIGMTEKNLSNIERGLQIPSLNSFLKIIDILNIPLTEFGIISRENKNKTRDELIKEIYLSNDTEVDVFFNIIKNVKRLKNS